MIAISMQTSLEKTMMHRHDRQDVAANELIAVLVILARLYTMPYMLL